MAVSAYLSIESINNGKLSSGCNTCLSMGNSYQSNHEGVLGIFPSKVT
uniref:Uncharacterized protein n=1 Tax=Aliivibrio wodanis TaxID=80852 RepID=A0A5Q4ZYJ9_9GAMM|nr:hypothetical protein AW0309160_04437 [Aliivibrio wodanis]